MDTFWTHLLFSHNFHVGPPYDRQEHQYLVYVEKTVDIIYFKLPLHHFIDVLISDRNRFNSVTAELILYFRVRFEFGSKDAAITSFDCWCKILCSNCNFINVNGMSMFYEQLKTTLAKIDLINSMAKYPIIFISKLTNGTQKLAL